MPYSKPPDYSHSPPTAARCFDAAPVQRIQKNLRASRQLVLEQLLQRSSRAVQARFDSSGRESENSARLFGGPLFDVSKDEDCSEPLRQASEAAVNELSQLGALQLCVLGLVH